jgi:TolB-like protein
VKLILISSLGSQQASMTLKVTYVPSGSRDTEVKSRLRLSAQVLLLSSYNLLFSTRARAALNAIEEISTETYQTYRSL